MRDSHSDHSSPWYAPLLLLASIAITVVTIGNTRSITPDGASAMPDTLPSEEELFEHGVGNLDFDAPLLGVDDRVWDEQGGNKPVWTPPGDDRSEPSLGAASLAVGELAMVNDPASLESSLPLIDGTIVTRRTQAFPTRGSGLNWQGLFDVVDPQRWRHPDLSNLTAGGVGLPGIGFPHLHVDSSPKRLRADSYKRMVSWHDIDGNGRHEPIAHVRCMGLSPPQVARRATRYNSMIRSLAKQHKVSPNLVKAVIAAESCFDEKAVSRVGALGLMQLMPATAAWLKAGDPRHPEENLKAGIRYLALLHTYFPDRRLALAAYNAGPGKVRRYGGIPPYQETRHYVQRVMAHYRRYKVASRLGGS